MENASKALIMAASVLLGVMLISIAVFLFSTFSDYSAESYKKMEQAKIDEFNSQFLKFYGTKINETTNNVEPILCTAHDIASLANLAKQNNTEYEVADLKEYAENTYYVQIYVEREGKLEQYNDEELLKFIKDNDIEEKDALDKEGKPKLDAEGKQEKEWQTKYYFVLRKPIISSATKRVCYIEFKEYKKYVP